jgi:hypothetical protein
MNEGSKWRAVSAAVIAGACGACQLIAGLEERTVAEQDADALDVFVPDVAADVAPDVATCTKCGTSACVDFTKDAKNCGYCGHDCGVGACNAGMCPTTTLWSTFDEATALAQDDTHLYVTDVNGVHVIDKTGSNHALVVSAYWPQGISMSGARMYVAEPWKVRDFALDGGDPHVIFDRSDASNGTPVNGDIAADPPRVFWGTQAGLFSADLDGSVDPIVPETDASVATSAVALDPSYVYFTTSAEVLRTPRAGGAVTHLASSLAGVTRLALTDAGVLWGDSVRVYYTTFDGGNSIIATANDVRDVVVYGDRVYYAATNFTVNAGVVATLPLAGGPSVTLAKANMPGRLVVDATSVYWLENIDNTPSVLRKVAR